MTGSTGSGMIEFAGLHMPALRSTTELVRRGGRLEGRRIGIALTLEPKTANLSLAIASLGAEVAVLGSSHSTKQDVADALADAGIAVFGEAGASPERAAQLRDAFIDTRPEFLSDDGAGITRRIHGDRSDVLPDLLGVAEETTSGVRPLRMMHGDGALRVPVVAVNDARTKLLFDNIYGTGQSVVMAVLDATNTQLQGKIVVVIGYGKVGRGIAAMARALGGRVTVTEIDPVEALAAHHDGFEVGRLADVVSEADLIITATGIGHSLTANHLVAMQEGAIVAVGGAGPPEFDPTIGPSATWGDEVRPNVRELAVEGGPTVFVIAGGYCANTSAGEGNPVEVMDLSLSLQLRALDHLAANDLPPGIHLLPRTVEDDIASAQLAAAGISIDEASADQTRAATSW